ncbi:hypothetical protein [Halanaerobium kushneri]|jgi:type II secretory pathway component PulC|uniref:Type IV pilus biogenesis n=1 Tax=Halanaerobium kushneri TaxID=56779 RepID=A0A1N6Q794_9FIRM|nr:hypothetical protein [Halanaerobium kushneri]SIQ12392.1 hypothetical protein SAMN05421834_101348 [Halanaerobium kushneri]
MKDNILIIFILVLIIFISSFSVLAENQNQEIYSGKEFRNPFIEFSEPKIEADQDTVPKNQNKAVQNSGSGQTTKFAPPKITVEDVKKELPFSLNGIISSNKEKVALLNTGGSMKLIRGNYKENDYQIISIEKESVIVQNRGFKLRLKIGGEVDEI